MSSLQRIRLEKAVADCGFERTPELTEDGALVLRSAQFPEVVWLHSLGSLQNSEKFMLNVTPFKVLGKSAASFCFWASTDQNW